MAAYGSAEERDRKAAEDAQKLSLEAKKAAKEAAQREAERAQAAQALLDEAAEVKALREAMIPKAHGVRRYKAITTNHSTKELTAPKTPNLSFKKAPRRSARGLERSSAIRIAK